MRHHNKNRKFGRKRNVRRALVKSLARAVVLDEKIITTEAKAKEMRPIIEKLVTLAKTDSLATRRILRTRIGSDEVTKKLVETIAPKYKARKGGYLRVVKLAPRIKDGSKMAVLEFV